MSDEMVKVLIVFAPDNQVFNGIALKMQEEFSTHEYFVVVKAAAKAAIPDIAAADLIIFGSEKVGKAVIHPDFNEICRALAGINLAGRVAGLFCLNSTETSTLFKKILKDSDITVYKEPLMFDSISQKDGIKNWISDLIKDDAFNTFFKE